MSKSKILITWQDNNPDRIVMQIEGKPSDMIVAMVNGLAEITRKIGKPETLHEMTACVSAEYYCRVFSDNLISAGIDVGGEQK